MKPGDSVIRTTQVGGEAWVNKRDLVAALRNNSGASREV